MKEMMRTITDINMPEQLLSYSRQRKAAMHQKAIQILLGAESSRKQDSLSISDTARSFSRESIGALIDKSANVSESDLTFYFNNYNNAEAILNAINFGENVSCGCNPNFKEFGVIYFEHNGLRQVVPNYAVPKMNAGALRDIYAVNNSLVLDNKSYYSWTASDGRKYAWSVHDGRIKWASSESLLSEKTNQRGTNYKWEMQKASNILSKMAQGGSPYGYDKADILSACEKVGIKPGFFSIDAGKGKHNYILQESGKIINVDAEIKRLNDINWIGAGYKEGDIFSVYGNEYTVDSSGHINASPEDGFTSMEIVYPARMEN